MTYLENTNVPFDEEWIFGPGDHRFYTRLFISPNRPRAIVLFLHGSMEHGGRYETVFPTWAAKDIAVFTFDQRGFGRTWYINGDEYKKAIFGKTSGVDQVRDTEFFLRELARRFPNTPIFLMGFSMGGGRVLHFVTRTTQPPAPETVQLLSGVIAYAPHVRQTHPMSKLLRVLLSMAQTISPYTTVNSHTKVETLSHSAVTNREWEEDTLIFPQETLRGVNDLLKDGEELATEGYRNWPETLPVLFLHGTDDHITCPVASRLFHDYISATDKTYMSFPKSYHELHNEARDLFNDSCIAWIESHLDQA